MKYVFSASILALALAILIYALMPRYYLIVASPTSSDSPVPVVQLGPFATQAGCERARLRVPDAMLGINLNEEIRELFSQHMVCVSSR